MVMDSWPPPDQSTSLVPRSAPVHSNDHLREKEERNNKEEENRERKWLLIRRRYIGKPQGQPKLSKYTTLWAMWRSVDLAKLVKQVSALGTITAPTLSYGYRTTVQDQRPIRRNGNAMPSSQDEFNNKINSQQHFQNDTNGMPKRQVGHNVSRANKIDFLLKTLMDLPNSKEDAYSALDAWVAWEESFPIGPLRKALIVLQKEEEWHKIIQVIKWILSKGQGTTMGVYGQLIKALDKDQRAEEAHEVLVKKVGTDLHSVPWELCELMISVYYRNNMLEQLVKLFKGLEAFDRKPRCKKTVKKVADAYGLLGLLEEKERVLEKYKNLFTETGQGSPKAKNKKKEKFVQGT